MPLLNYTNDFASLINQPEDWNKCQQSFNEIRAVLNALDDANFVAGSGMYTAYRELLMVRAQTTSDMVAGTYVFTPSGALGASGSAGQIDGRYLDDADYAISGRTLKLRLRAQVSTNATQPTITFTFGLYPVTFAGGADAFVPTLGTVVSGSTVAIASPAASSTTQGSSGDFTFPADGFYAIGVVTSGTLTNNNASMLHVQLQQHWT